MHDLRSTDLVHDINNQNNGYLYHMKLISNHNYLISIYDKNLFIFDYYQNQLIKTIKNDDDYKFRCVAPSSCSECIVSIDTNYPLTPTDRKLKVYSRNNYICCISNINEQFVC